MSYELTLEGNLLLGKWHENFDYLEESANYSDEVVDLLDTATGKVYFIHQFGGVKLTTSDIIQGASNSTRNGRKPFKHPAIEQIIFVTTNKALAFATKGMNTVSFGNVDIKVYETLDEALAYVRSRAA